ncbi:MAG: SDR family oxidoreductase [Syntrophaceae bacterium]|nr:SDR family oxidoreductase [Syntrophaceae bacterium]
MKLKDRVALITGAGSGMGRASAILFSKEGARVAVADLDERNGQETVRLVQKEKGEAFFIQTDVSKTVDAEKMIKATVDKYGTLNILFNNAGIPMSFTPVEEVKEELWDRIMDVNVKAIFLASKFAVPIMKKQGGGVILITASISGVRPRPGLSAYSTSKAAAIMLTKALAIEFAPYKIRVNAINPVAAETPMLAHFIASGGAKGDQFESGRKRFVDTVPLGRLATAEDIAYMALFLASDEASLITGASFDVDGGRGI